MRITLVDHPLVQHKLAHLRDKRTGPKDFRELAEEVAMLMAYEAMRDLELEETTVETPIAPARVKVLSGKKLKERGATGVKLMAILAAPEGLERIAKDHPDTEVVVAAIDERLNDHGYIVPGLGDAGDRIYGTK